MLGRCLAVMCATALGLAGCMPSEPPPPAQTTIFQDWAVYDTVGSDGAKQCRMFTIGFTEKNLFSGDLMVPTSITNEALDAVGALLLGPGPSSTVPLAGELRLIPPANRYNMLSIARTAGGEDVSVVYINLPDPVDGEPFTLAAGSAVANLRVDGERIIPVS